MEVAFEVFLDVEQVPVRDHGAPALLLRHVVRLDRLGHCANLVHLIMGNSLWGLLAKK